MRESRASHASSSGRFRRWGICAVAVCLGAGSWGGCSRLYLTKTHGRAYSEAFSQQKVYPDGAPRNPKSIEGLDSQEAAAIAGTYRRSLAKESATDGNGGPLVMTNPAMGPGAAGPNLPPPSVPDRQ